MYLTDSHSGCTNLNMCIPAPSGFVFNNISGFFPEEISVFKAKQDQGSLQNQGYLHNLM